MSEIDDVEEAEACSAPDTFDPELESATRALLPIDAPLPSPSAGLYGYTPAAKLFGTRDVVAALVEIGRIWSHRHPDRPIGVGDISRSGGGELKPHASHRRGSDVDLRPCRTDSDRIRVDYEEAEYSRDLTQELVDIIHANGRLAVKLVFFNDPEVASVRPLAGHHNHLHVSFLAATDGPAIPVIAEGAQAPSVRDLKRRLNFWLARHPETGIAPVSSNASFGALTRIALQAFQRAEGLPASGKFDQRTWERLPLGPPLPQSPRSLKL